MKRHKQRTKFTSWRSLSRDLSNARSKLSRKMLISDKISSLSKPTFFIGWTKIGKLGNHFKTSKLMSNLKKKSRSLIGFPDKSNTNWATLEGPSNLSETKYSLCLRDKGNLDRKMV